MDLFQTARSALGRDYNQRSQKTTRSITAVYALVVFSGFLISANFYLFGINPLSDLLLDFQDKQISYELHDASRDIDEVMIRHQALSTQVASRTAIRKRQADYLQGKLTLQDLVSFSKPKLADALTSRSDIIGISRYAPDGRLLFSVGETPRNDTSAACRDARTGAVGVQPLQLEPLRLIYCSPIKDAVSGVLGFDLIVFKAEAIQHILNELHREVSSFALVQGQDNIVLRQTRPGHTVGIDALRGFLGGQAQDGYVIEGAFTKIPELRLFTIVHREGFNAQIQGRLTTLVVTLGFVALIVLSVSMLLLKPLMRLVLNEQRLVEMATYDMMTGLLNANAFQGALDYEIERARRYDGVLSLIMFDVDFFKDVNDTHGHMAGDQVLRQMGKICKDTFRQVDVCARYGGEEFVVILPETSEEHAGKLAERLRLAIEQAVFETNAGGIRVTVSAGVLTWNPKVHQMVKSDLLARVDAALYASKAAGRNCITLALME